MNTKTLSYYAELAYSILHNENSLQYAKDKEIISNFFTKFILDDYLTNENIIILKSRLSLIDSYYSTNVNNYRLFGIEDIIEGIKSIANSDYNFIEKIKYYVECIKVNDFTEEVKLGEISYFFERKYGIDKLGNNSSHATSLISKYCYFLTNYKFPIYDSLVKDNYKSIANYFGISFEYCNNNFVLFDKFVSKMLVLNRDINDLNKLDNLMWLFGKIKKGNFSLILSKENYIKLIDIIKRQNSDFKDKISSKRIDETISNFVLKQHNALNQFHFFDNKILEFIEFVRTVIDYQDKRYNTANKCITTSKH